MKRWVSSWVGGMLFGAGLVVSGMTKPSKVQGFLDVFGAWDPSLAFVMVGAIGVYAAASRWVLRRSSPLFEGKFHLPTRRDIDGRLLFGSLLFGVGWGLSGYCPGPSIVAVGSGLGGAWVFAGAMVVGALLEHTLTRLWTSRRTSRPSREPSLPSSDSWAQSS